MKQKKFKDDASLISEKEKKVKVKAVETPILAKYKAPSARAEAERTKIDEELAKKLEKEKQRSMGRKIPTKDDETYERSLVLIATKGVVQLFNTVTEY